VNQKDRTNVYIIVIGGVGGWLLALLVAECPLVSSGYSNGLFSQAPLTALSCLPLFGPTVMSPGFGLIWFRVRFEVNMETPPPLILPHTRTHRFTNSSLRNKISLPRNGEGSVGANHTHLPTLV